MAKAIEIHQRRKLLEEIIKLSTILVDFWLSGAVL